MPPAKKRISGQDFSPPLSLELFLLNSGPLISTSEELST